MKILFTKNGHLRIDLSENLRFNLYAGGTLDLFEVDYEPLDGLDHINLPYPIELPKWLADAIREAAQKEINKDEYSKSQTLDDN